MSPYSGGRGLNVSQFLRELNTVKEPGSAAADEIFGFDDDIVLTETQFFDFDSGQHTDFQAPPAKPEAEPQASSGAVTEELPSPLGDFGNVDFSMPGEFQFTDFTNSYSPSGVPSFTEALGSLQSLQPNPQPSYAPPPAAQQQNHHYGPPTPRAADSRTPESLNGASRSAPGFEEQSRLAAEEDKRRRNTAASARFRVKKKQREQALEKNAKEMTDKVQQLEQRINLLETENRWLKNLVMEKNDGHEDIAAMLKEFQSKQPPKPKTSTANSDSVKEEK